MAIQRSHSTQNGANLSEDFGLQLAMKKLGLTEAQLEEKLGRYTRGKRKGKIRGRLTWWKVVEGGWVSTGYHQGFVCRFRDITYGYMIVDGYTGEVLLAGHPYPTEALDLQKKVEEKNKELASADQSA
jgi:hypothetical protein